MSDLGAIFHVKKAGVQYNAHAYTTLDECPEPNLKIKFKGSTAYVMLVAKGSGNVPCYVKKSNGSVYQVNKEAVPAGTINLSFDAYGETYFTVPNGIKVIKAEATSTNAATYIGVTPNISYHLWRHRDNQSDYPYKLECFSHKIVWQKGYTKRGNYKLSWSSQINNHAITVSDYH